MKEKREVDLSQKGTLEAFELSDDDMEQVIGGYTKVERTPVNSGVFCIDNCNGAGVNYCMWSVCPFKHK